MNSVQVKRAQSSFKAHGSKTAKKSTSAFPAHTRSGLTEKAKDTKNAANGLF